RPKSWPGRARYHYPTVTQHHRLAVAVHRHQHVRPLHRARVDHHPLAQTGNPVVHVLRIAVLRTSTQAITATFTVRHRVDPVERHNVINHVIPLATQAITDEQLPRLAADRHRHTGLPTGPDHYIGSRRENINPTAHGRPQPVREPARRRPRPTR